MVSFFSVICLLRINTSQRPSFGSRILTLDRLLASRLPSRWPPSALTELNVFVRHYLGGFYFMGTACVCFGNLSFSFTHFGLRVFHLFLFYSAANVSHPGFVFSLFRVFLPEVTYFSTSIAWVSQVLILRRCVPKGIHRIRRNCNMIARTKAVTCYREVAAHLQMERSILDGLQTHRSIAPGLGVTSYFSQQFLYPYRIILKVLEASITPFKYAVR